nr:RNA-directed DNA polymerase, eukaryota [Tanacetum cinerariifolium]
MGNFRTKEDEVSKISTSIFVSNFSDSLSSKDLFHACKQYVHVVDSFIPSKRAKDDFTLGGRIAWVEVEGIPFKVWSGHTFNRIALKWGKLMEVDDYDDMNFHSMRLLPGWTLEFTEEEEKDYVSVEDIHGGIHSDQEINNCNDESDVEEVPETCFNVPEGQKGNPSEDPFGIYHLLNKDKNIREHKINEEEFSLKYPPGFTPVGNLNEGHLDGGCAKKTQWVRVALRNQECHASPKRLKKIGLGELCIKNKVNFVVLQETKIESIDLLSVSSCWGNLMFDYVHSDSVGNSGGILCMWDPNSFWKSSFTRSDYFVIIRGLWLKSGIKLMIVVVYAPQEASEKCMLWDYLTHVSDQWDGEIVMMEDFNEVRYKS